MVQRRRWLPRAALLAGAGLLALVLVPQRRWRAQKQAKRRGRSSSSSLTDIDYIDSQLTIVERLGDPVCGRVQALQLSRQAG